MVSQCAYFGSSAIVAVYLLNISSSLYLHRYLIYSLFLFFPLFLFPKSNLLNHYSYASPLLSPSTFCLFLFIFFSGDKTIEWDENFRLFFTTKLANPHYSPEIMGKTMIINYGVTMDGLANQLLNVVVANERPDLEKQWADLVSQMGEDALLLVTLEDTLLRELSSSQVCLVLKNHPLCNYFN